MATSKVDFPVPFSPAKKVTGAASGTLDVAWNTGRRKG
jgi:hypothetical protein